jgi:protein-L-isoaspartate O-methyltransferase
MRPTQEDLLATVTAQGVTDERLFDGFRALPRADFVPALHPP